MKHNKNFEYKIHLLWVSVTDSRICRMYRRVHAEVSVINNRKLSNPSYSCLTLKSTFPFSLSCQLYQEQVRKRVLQQGKTYKIPRTRNNSNNEPVSLCKSTNRVEKFLKFL